MALALITLTLLVSPLRLAAIVPAAAGLWLAASPKRFDIYIDRDGSGVAIRASNRQLVMMGRVPAFVAEQWLKADGDGRKADDASLRVGARCDALGCVMELHDARAVALVRDRRAFDEDCPRAVIVIARLPAPAACTPPVLLDRAFFAAHGATAIRLTAAGHDIVTTRRPSEARPGCSERDRTRRTGIRRWTARTAAPPRNPHRTRRSSSRRSVFSSGGRG